jgi:hypothetical protein
LVEENTVQQLIYAVCVVAFLVIGLLIMIQAISLNEEGHVTTGTLRLLVLFLVIVWALKGIFVEALRALAAMLMVGVVALFIVALALISAMALGRFFIARNAPVRRGDPQEVIYESVCDETKGD